MHSTLKTSLFVISSSLHLQVDSSSTSLTALNLVKLSVHGLQCEGRQLFFFTPFLISSYFEMICCHQFQFNGVSLVWSSIHSFINSKLCMMADDASTVSLVQAKNFDRLSYEEKAAVNWCCLTGVWSSGSKMYFTLLI